MTEKGEQDKVLSRLDQIARVLALGLLRDLPSKQRIELLSTAGFTPSEIARLLGITATNVRVTMYNIRQAKLKKKAKQARRSRR
jgi:DNA-directed RNA polymerase specialized sigma24 family protein